MPKDYTYALILPKRYPASAPAAIDAPILPAGGICGTDDVRMNTITPAATKAIS